MKNFSGKVLFLDRSDINTDEIIPAKYLTELTKEGLRPYLLEDLKLERFNPKKDLEGVKVVVAKENFGCGSSREHAPWVFEVNDINLVIACNFARIFRQNMFNNGMMAISLPAKTINELFEQFSDVETFLTTDFAEKTFLFESSSGKRQISFEIADFDRELVKAGGWVSFADNNY